MVASVSMRFAPTLPEPAGPTTCQAASRTRAADAAKAAAPKAALRRTSPSAQRPTGRSVAADRDELLATDERAGRLGHHADRAVLLRAQHHHLADDFVREGLVVAVERRRLDGGFTRVVERGTHARVLGGRLQLAAPRIAMTHGAQTVP